MKTSLSLFILGLTLLWHPVKAELAKNSSLYVTIKKMDTLLFEEGFNHCNIKTLKDITHKKLRFYHDTGGQQNKNQFIKATQENICGQPGRKITRQLVDDSLHIYPLKNNGNLYGAIQKGIHEFYIRENDAEKHITGRALFTHVWVLEDKKWSLIESLSYEHQAVDTSLNQSSVDDKFNAHFPTKLFDRDVFVKELLEQHKIPSLAMGYIENGRLQQIKVFQNNQIKSDYPYGYDSIYKVASLTKPIVALTTLKLVSQNKWDLDKPIKDYYLDPDLAASTELNTLTTRHILSHQSGLPNWRYLQKDSILKFQFTPGSKYQYSGEGFEYLRKALEHTFNKDLNELSRELLFEPLGMNNTSFYWSSEIDEKNYAIEHDENGELIEYVKHKKPNAAANLLTTIEDYGLFLQYILNGAGLNKDLYQDMISNQLHSSEDKKFGLGWEILELIDGQYALQHTGGDYGIKTLAFILPKSKSGLVIFTNSENGMVVWTKIVTEIFGELGQSLIDANLK